MAGTYGADGVRGHWPPLDRRRPARAWPGALVTLNCFVVPALAVVATWNGYATPAIVVAATYLLVFHALLFVVDRGIDAAWKGAPDRDDRLARARQATRRLPLLRPAYGPGVDWWQGVQAYARAEESCLPLLERALPLSHRVNRCWDRLPNTDLVVRALLLWDHTDRARAAVVATTAIERWAPPDEAELRNLWRETTLAELDFREGRADTAENRLGRLPRDPSLPIVRFTTALARSRGGALDPAADFEALRALPWGQGPPGVQGPAARQFAAAALKLGSEDATVVAIDLLEHAADVLADGPGNDVLQLAASLATVDWQWDRVVHILGRLHERDVLGDWLRETYLVALVNAGDGASARQVAGGDSRWEGPGGVLDLWFGTPPAPDDPGGPPTSSDAGGEPDELRLAGWAELGSRHAEAVTHYTRALETLEGTAPRSRFFDDLDRYRHERLTALTRGQIVCGRATARGYDGDLDGARRDLAEAGRLVDDGVPTVRTVAAVAEAVVLAREGDLDGADRTFAEAIERAEAHGARPLAIETRCDQARAWIEAGRTEEGRRVLLDSAAAFDELGLHRLAAKARRDLHGRSST